ncbi:hypothetical protein SAMN04490190_5939 [Pseudomonas libanensis]|nr:hypothetical protein SAMN04490190_5939 [Pseudomonas libanensis]
MALQSDIPPTPPIPCGARQLPHFGGVAVEGCACRDGPAKRYTTYTADPLWELSSFSEAAKAVVQTMKRLPVPPPSQPRWGSAAPTFGRCCCRGLCLSRWPCKAIFHLHRRSPVGAVELQRGCESGGSGDEEVACAAAIAASLGLDSSHIWAVLLSRVVLVAMALQSDIHIHRRSPVGAVELQRGCEGGGSGDEEVACAAAIAASLGLDSSHIWAVLLSRVVLVAMALQSDIPLTPPIPCGSCRASARLRRRRFRR